MNDLLTEREKQVCTLVAAGLTDDQIAARLYVSTSTAKVHIRNIIRKLNAPNRTGAVVIMLINGHLNSESIRQQIPISIN